jgi:hypothetical protein
VLTLKTDLLAEAREFFELCGTEGHEGTAMIIGGAAPRLVIPDQRVHGQRRGAAVEVTRAGQMQLALALDTDETYAARIHSHPLEAFHSPTDDANPVLPYQRALSIVVPYFGLGLRGGLDACAVYIRDGAEWHELPPGPKRARHLQEALS